MLRTLSKVHALFQEVLVYAALYFFIHLMSILLFGGQHFALREQLILCVLCDVLP